MNEQNKTRTFFRSLLPVLLAFSIQNGITFFMMQVMVVIKGVDFKGTKYIEFVDDISRSMLDKNFLSVISLLYAAVCVIIYAFWFKKFKGEGSAKRLSLKGYSGIIIPGILLFAAGAQVFSNYYVSVLGKLFPTWLTEYTEIMEKAGLTSGSITPIMVLYAMILGPLAEELIFRGLTFTTLRKSFGFWTANIIQAALFAGYHLNKLQAAYAFLIGLALGYAAEKTGNLYVTMLIHVAYNSMAFFMAIVLEMVPDSPILTFVMILGSLLLLYSGLMIVGDSVPEDDNAAKNDMITG